MSTASFDTHTFVKRLVSAGMPETQAEILAEEQARVLSSDLVTKGYLSKELELLQQRLTIKLGGMLVVAVGAMAALVKLL